jgi:arylsulfatase A-like enzyme
MSLPGTLPAGLRIRTPVQLLDLMPTILDLAGVDRAPLLLQGDSLLPLIRAEAPDFWERRVLVSEEPTRFRKLSESEVSASAIFGPYHLIDSSKLDGERLFHLDEDGSEESPIEAPELLAFLNGRIHPYLLKLYAENQAIWRVMTADSPDIVYYDPEAQEQLRALGYIE